MATGANGLSAFHFQLLEDLMRTKKLSATAANLDTMALISLLCTA